MTSQVGRAAISIIPAGILAAVLWLAAGTGMFAAIVGIVTAGLLWGLLGASASGSKLSGLAILVLGVLIIAALAYFGLILMMSGGWEH